MDQAILRFLIREKLATGCLPHDHILRVWGAPGQGETCDGCGGTVTRAQTLMEGALDAEGCGVRFHVECFASGMPSARHPGTSRADPRN